MNSITYNLSSLVILSAKKCLLKKAVFSKPDRQSGITKAVASAVTIRNTLMLQLEIFHTDNKATHKNLDPTQSETVGYFTEFCKGFSQVNVITTVGDCEYRRAPSGKEIILGGDKLRTKLENAEASRSGIEVGGHNRVKNYILSGNEEFLIKLGISDTNGRPHDKKLPKLRQINRFLEYVRDAEKYLPSTDPIYICDLCCGKSYLSFAVYHYFANIKGRKTFMTGVDLKPDVTEYCNSVACELGFDGMRFICGDVSKFEPEVLPSLVISLHACDTATDLVLGLASKWRARVILSTPCCHHEMNHYMNCPGLAFIAEHSMLRQKFCDAATDSLRLKLLQGKGYKTAAFELVDPDDTPKNIILRAVLHSDGDDNAMKEYEEAYRFIYGKEPSGKKQSDL